MKAKIITSILFVCLLSFYTGVEAQQMKKNSKKQGDVSGDLNPNVKAEDPVLGQNPSLETISAAWTTLAVSPKAQSRSFCVYARPGGTEYLYQFGGGAGATLKTIARYDIAANTWTTLVPILNLDVSSGAAINYGDSVIYIFGGNSGTATLGSTQKFNIGTGIVTTMATMPVLVTDAAVVKYQDTLVYLVGGGTGLFGVGYFNNVQVYNIKQNTYAAATPYPVAAGMMGFGIDGNKIICAGGWNGTVGIPDAYKGVIDPTNHLNITWTAIPNYPGGNITRMASYFVQKGSGKGVMMTGGAVGGATLTNKTYLFNTVCEAWDSTLVNSQARSNFKAAGRGDSVAWVVAGFTTVAVGTTERITFSLIDCSTFTNDVASLSVNNPPLGIALPSPAIIPQATVKNVGTATQTFNVTMTISPGGYTSTQNVVSLPALGSTNVNFASYTPLAGNYTVTVYTQLAGDQNLLNDTVRQSLSVIQPNYGGGGTGTGGYFFANSTADASPAPSQPTYCRVDTAGSTTLVSNSVAVTTITNGSLDDGYWALTGIFGAKKIKFMGVEYDSVFIGTNGIIGLSAFTPGGGNWDPPVTGLPGGTVRPAIYPAWNDLNWGNLTQPVNRLSYKVDAAKNRLVITYDRAPLFSGLATDWETFQVCIDLVNTGSPNSNFTISHDNTTSVINIPYLVGMQDATGANYLQYTFINAAGNVITPGPLFDTTGGVGGVSITFGPDANKLNGPCDKILALKFNFQACPNAGAISVLLRNAASPYAIVDSVVATGGGNAINPVYFENAGNGNAYYVVVRSANSVETWSSSNVTFNGGSASYDFTTALAQAYGSNQLISTVGNPGIPSIYQGDANQDGLVDLTDIILVFNAASAFTTGPATDFNCDGTTDLTDIILAFNNAGQFIQIQRP